jgi:hypothetical protein
MNVENEINKHEPYKLDDISCVNFDLDFEEAISGLPDCIICRLTDLEDYYEDLSKNTFCACNFYFHPSCYEEWAEYKKSNKCLICNKDISSNYYIPPPEISPRTRRERFEIRREELQLLRNIRIIEREPKCNDKCCNIICCRLFRYNSRNPCVTCIMLNEKPINTIVCATVLILIFVTLGFLIFILLTRPLDFVLP